MKIYYLKDPVENRIIAKFELIDEERFEGECYEAITWDMRGNVLEWLFHSRVYVKWDGCSHWWLLGEDEEDSYYHLCGSGSFDNHIRLMCFVWELATKYHKKNMAMLKEEFETKLIYFMLEGYEIIMEEK